MNQEDFRRQLRDESQKWQQEGLIEPYLYDLLSERYSFEDLTDDHHNRFIGILLGLGGILLGLGAITFVAANWQVWSRLARMLLLLVLFLGVNGTGFYLWKNPGRRTRLHRLGHGLLLTGGLVLGANLGLMSQMFHQSGPIYQLFLVWSLGVLVMAYGLRLLSLGILSWILMLLGYWNSGGVSPGSGDDLFAQIIFYLPLLISLLYLPLAHWLRSRWMFGLWGVSFLMLMSFSPLMPFGWTYSVWLSWESFASWSLAAGFVIPPALLWAYRADWRFSSRQRSQRPIKDLFQPIGRSLSVWSVSFTLYFYAFRFPWKESVLDHLASHDLNPRLAPVMMILIYGAIAAYGWWQVFIRERGPRRSRWLTSSVMGGLLISLFGLAIACHSEMSLTIIGPVLINLLLFGLSILLIHDGLTLKVRRRFWGGMLILVIGLVSRMFEYNTELTLKALVLSLCGLGIIAAGLWFEYRTQQPEPPALPESNL